MISAQLKVAVRRKQLPVCNADIFLHGKRSACTTLIALFLIENRTIICLPGSLLSGNQHVTRDARSLEKLHELGWRTAIVWECAIGRQADPALIEEVIEFFRSDRGHQAFEQRPALGIV